MPVLGGRWAKLKCSVMIKNIISRVNVICGNRVALKCLLAALLISAGVGTASAYDFEVGGIYYYTSGTTAEVVNGDSPYVGDIVIPQRVSHDGKTYDVVSIGWSAFENCESLTSIDMPYITEIKAFAFCNCTSLASVNMPQPC